MGEWGCPPRLGPGKSPVRGWETAGSKGRFQLEKQQRALRAPGGGMSTHTDWECRLFKGSRGKWSSSAPSRGFLSLLQHLPVAERLQRVLSAPGRGAKAGRDGGGAVMEHPCWKITRHSIVEFFPSILTLCLAHSRLSRSQGAFAMDTGHVSRSRFSGESSLPREPGKGSGQSCWRPHWVFSGKDWLVLDAFHGENLLLHVPAGFCFLKQG